MKAVEVENLTVADIIADRENIVAALAEGEAPNNLAGRYVRARLDAKRRDEKLGEQGEMITALERKVKDFTQRCESLEYALKAEKELSHNLGLQLKQLKLDFQKLNDTAAKKIGEMEAMLRLLRSAQGKRSVHKPPQPEENTGREDGDNKGE